MSSATGMRPDLLPPKDWKKFWASVHVDPPPPEDFLDVSYNGRVLNLTNGQLSDEVVRQWVLASMRRGKADAWSAYHLREDMINANVFGPPGLNGTLNGVEQMRAKGIERIEGAMENNAIAAAVIAVPKSVQETDTNVGLTDYVIVTLHRSGAWKSTTVYEDGRREEASGKATGKLSWQLDTGFFYESPALGPLWYQSRGWSCEPGDSAIGKLCAMVKP